MPSMGLTDVLVALYFDFADGIGEVSAEVNVPILSCRVVRKSS